MATATGSVQALKTTFLSVTEPIKNNEHLLSDSNKHGISIAI